MLCHTAPPALPGPRPIPAQPWPQRGWSHGWGAGGQEQGTRGWPRDKHLALSSCGSRSAPGLWHRSPGGQEGARLSWQLVPTARDPILLPGQLPDMLPRSLPRKGPSTAWAMEANPPLTPAGAGGHFHGAAPAEVLKHWGRCWGSSTGN